MNSVVRWGLAIAVLQGALGLGYWWVQRKRNTETSLGVPLSTTAPTQFDMSLPVLTLQNRDGKNATLPLGPKPLVLHFWATWCPPCRAELPALLALRGRHDVEVRAVALDPTWDTVREFLNDDIPAVVLLGDAHSTEVALDVHTLPTTFVVRPNGTAALRFDGARNWSDDEFVARWLGD